MPYTPRQHGRHSNGSRRFSVRELGRHLLEENQKMKSCPIKLVPIALFSAILVANSPRATANEIGNQNPPQLTLELREIDTDKPVGGVTLNIDTTVGKLDTHTTGKDGRAVIKLPMQPLEYFSVKTSQDGW